MCPGRRGVAGSVGSCVLLCQRCAVDHSLLSFPPIIHAINQIAAVAVRETKGVTSSRFKEWYGSRDFSNWTAQRTDGLSCRKKKLVVCSSAPPYTLLLEDLGKPPRIRRPEEHVKMMRLMTVWSLDFERAQDCPFVRARCMHLAGRSHHAPSRPARRDRRDLLQSMHICQEPPANSSS